MVPEQRRDDQGSRMLGPAMDLVERRDGILGTVAVAAERLLLTPDWRRAMDEVLERLGRAAAVSRTWLLEKHLDDLGGPHSSPVAEWAAAGTQVDDQALQEAPWLESGFSRWAELLRNGQVVCGSVADFPDAERPALESRGVVSILAIPVFAGSEWWGVIGFDECTEERDWTRSEIDVLRAAAGIVGAAIHREQADTRSREAEERYRAIVDRTPAITYQEVSLEGGDWNDAVIYVSPQVEDILGYTVEQFLQPAFWTTIVHRDDLEEVLREGERTALAGEPFSMEYRMIAADDRVVWIHDRAVRLPIGPDRREVWQGVMIDITERKLAEERLKETELHYRKLVEHLPVVTYRDEVSVDDPTDAVPAYIGPQIEQLLGCTPEEWVTDPDRWGKSVHPEDRERVERAGDEARITGAPFHAEYRMLHGDGRIIWVQEESVLVRDDDGRPRYWQGVYSDITERKGVEERLRDAEDRYRSLVERLPAVVYIESIARVPGDLYMSPRVTDVFGYTPDEWRWTRGFWIARIHPDDRGRIRLRNEHVNATGEPFAEEYRFLCKDGRYRWVLDEAFLVRNDDGSPRYWQGFLMDVTDRKEAELQLREAEERFRTLVEQNPAVIYTQVIDPEDPTVSNTVYISPSTEQLDGYTVEETMANPQRWRDTIHPDDRELVYAADAESNATGEPFDLEYRIVHRAGRVVWVHDRATMIKDERGNPRFWQGVMIDITERKEAEERLAHALDVEREATRRLRMLDEMKNTFLQAVSHDLRTPLAAILGLAVTLERGDLGLTQEEARELAGRIAGNARKLDRLVTDLLDLDRLARGIVEPKLYPTDLGALARRVASESDLASNGLLEVEAEDLVLDVDAPKVERIIENLLANTARHTPNGTRVWIRVGRSDGGALISVEDDGPGIAPEFREMVFEPFRQGPDAPTHSPGVGVGLTLVARFAELHGGRAWVEEREGGGAAFNVFLPAGSPPST